MCGLTGLFDLRTASVFSFQLPIKKFVWRGTASSTISSNPQKVDKTLDKALTKMFDNYPPKPKK
jgi:hypothetical protein